MNAIRPCSRPKPQPGIEYFIQWLLRLRHRLVSEILHGQFAGTFFRCDRVLGLSIQLFQFLVTAVVPCAALRAMAAVACLVVLRLVPVTTVLWTFTSIASSLISAAVRVTAPIAWAPFTSFSLYAI